jgi:hypothetical protein
MSEAMPPTMAQLPEDEWTRRVALCGKRSGWNDAQLWTFIEMCINDRATLSQDGVPVLLDADLALNFFTWFERSERQDGS